MWRTWERSYPYLFALMAGVLAYRFGTSNLYAGMENAIGEVVSASSIIVGFLATAMAIMMSIGDNPILKRLKEAGSYKRILGYLWAAAFSALALVAVSVVLKFASNTPHFDGSIRQWSTALWMALAVLVLFSSYRSIHLIYVLLRHLEK